jgi:hypothetical protein
MHRVLPTGNNLPGLEYVSMSLDIEILGEPTLFWYRFIFYYKL